MDFNTLLNRLGISSENFENSENEPVAFKNGMIYEVEQRKSEVSCPNCGSVHCNKMGHYFTETKCNQNDHFTDIVRIKRLRLRCMDCGKTFSPKIKGISKNSRISEQVMDYIYSDFTKPQTFNDIAKRYGLTKNRIIQIFDEKIRFVPRREMPETLCIDEIRFSEDIDQKYCCVLYDFDRKEIVDIIRNRQLAYLREYFASIPIDERKKTKVFISDMYDAYATVCANYFPNATHIVDKFHIVTQLTRAVNKLRVNTMNGWVEKDSTLYNFMKSNWKLFLCNKRSIPDKTYTNSKTGKTLHFDDLVFNCIKVNPLLWTGYSALQDLLSMPKFSTYEEAERFFMFLSNKLMNSQSEILTKVGETFLRWKCEIGNAYISVHKGLNYTNSIAECINNQLKTIIKSAYGYRNFERFRKRAMLIITYSKP